MIPLDTKDGTLVWFVYDCKVCSGRTTGLQGLATYFGVQPEDPEDSRDVMSVEELWLSEGDALGRCLVLLQARVRETKSQIASVLERMCALGLGATRAPEADPTSGCG